MVVDRIYFENLADYQSELTKENSHTTVSGITEIATDVFTKNC
jgi:hypothetical protein